MAMVSFTVSFYSYMYVKRALPAKGYAGYRVLKINYNIQKVQPDTFESEPNQKCQNTDILRLTTK